LLADDGLAGHAKFKISYVERMSAPGERTPPIAAAQRSRAMATPWLADPERL
jgi:hypothetical protein